MEQPSANPIPPKALEWLEACQYPRELIDSYREETRLVQDIGIVGHTLEGQLQILRDVFHVDFSGVSVAQYFPSPLGIEALVISILPRSGWAKRVLERYPPITLGMIDEAIKNKRWVFEDSAR
jgi:hypothetical protein